ncbi:MAG: aminopeptidase N C-terminal domain-containing protein [Kiritimatiellae bacterium]|nr:aminopeptidase N C-terminal domain-containing protein [Kiritimatiellia bacterium]
MEKSNYRFNRSDFRLPDFQLIHVEAKLEFYEDRVDGSETLTLAPRQAADLLTLDAKALTIFEVADPASETPLQYEEDTRNHKLKIRLPREFAAGETVKVFIRCRCVPSDTILEGIYRDTTPPGCPQQYMSQCQQIGFQRILPIIDDCTAKCTFRTTLEGDSRYTHLISNGDPDPATNPDGVPVPVPGNPARQTITYENRVPMAPYLFIACAGTWESLSDTVSYPDGGKTVKLEYLVPPGHLDGAKIPMQILKDSVLFQHRLTGFVYPYQTYRTICMEKSLYGGMENTGNTTIITEAALIDDTIADQRMIYAYGVIPHEYEHSHCGSGVTMETLFDMWLNEAYTVNIERAFLAKTFGSAFMRSQEIESLRTNGGAFAEEEGGTSGSVVREGVNDPDEVVDAITYDKAPEVLNTLKNLIGEEKYHAAWREYFRRFSGGNANTDDFLKVFTEVSGRDIGQLMRPWLFDAGHPTVRAAWEWENGELSITLERDGDYTVPVPYALVKDGRDVANGTFVLDGAKQRFTTRCPKPDFISWNRGCGFYGVLTVDAAEEQLILQARTDPNAFNRAEAMKMLRDMGASEVWLQIYREVFFDAKMDLGDKALMLAIPSDSLDRRRRAMVRENVREMHALRQAAAREIGIEALIAAIADSATGGQDAAAIIRRSYENRILQLLSEIDRPEVWDAIIAYLDRAQNITARINALGALVAGNCPRRYEVLAAEGEKMRQSINGYSSYLRLVASDPHDTVFEAIATEEQRPGWSISHPAFSRALYCGFAANADRLWTQKGLEWIESTIIKYAKVSEYNALRLLVPFLNWRWFEPELRETVRLLLARIAAALPQEQFAFIGGRLAAMLK